MVYKLYKAWILSFRLIYLLMVIVLSFGSDEGASLLIFKVSLG